MYINNDEIEKAIKILLPDGRGTYDHYHMHLKWCYNNNVPFEQGCSVNIIAQRTAQYYLQIREKGKAIACTEYFDESKNKVSLFKKAKQIDEAVQILFTNKHLYHLLKSQRNFERGAEIAQKLSNNQVHCKFLLLLVKEKLIKYSSIQ